MHAYTHTCIHTCIHAYVNKTGKRITRTRKHTRRKVHTTYAPTHTYTHVRIIRAYILTYSGECHHAWYQHGKSFKEGISLWVVVSFCLSVFLSVCLCVCVSSPMSVLLSDLLSPSPPLPPSSLPGHPCPFLCLCQCLSFDHKFLIVSSSVSQSVYLNTHGTYTHPARKLKNTFCIWWIPNALS